MPDVRSANSQMHGTIAHDAADQDNPIKIGGKAQSATPTAVSDANDRVDAWFDMLGRMVSLPFTNEPLTAYLNVTDANEATLVTGTAGKSIYVTSLHGSNAGASLSTVQFKDGNAGSTKFAFAMAANGGGFTVNLNVPWKLTAAANLRVVQSAGVSAHVTVTYFVA